MRFRLTFLATGLLIGLALVVQPIFASNSPAPQDSPSSSTPAVRIRLPALYSIASTATATPTATSTPDPARPHAGITQYNGPQTCVACHPSQGDAAVHTEHVQWLGKWPQINTYCTAPEPSQYQCLSCHATTGKTDPQRITANDVDCLMCHSETYLHVPGPLTGSITVTDWQGLTKTVAIPQPNAQGDYTLVPKLPAGTTIEQLAQNVTKPTRATCLKCHARAGGADGAKRGDISSANANPARTSDVHMSPQGGNFTCQTCHVTSDHKIAGKGIDLRIAEGTVKACADCHGAKPHSDSRLNLHTDHVACQTCHIPLFGKDVATEMTRDWTHPKWNATTNQWVPEDTTALNAKPKYTFWNGTSFVYDLQNPISPNPDGTYTVSRANGSVNETASKLYPIKLHTANQPRDNATGALVAFDTRWYFLTGRADEAAQRGLAFKGSAGPYTWVTTKAEQLITHGVEPRSNALQCQACHVTRTQMDLRTLGYTLKGPDSQVCNQCHSVEPRRSFYEMHDKHVTSKRYDCVWCHTFTRPERGLRIP